MPGAAEAVGLLQDAGERVLFVTNNSGRRVLDTEEKLAGLGIDARGGVITSGRAAARLVAPGEGVLGMCGPGGREEREAVGAGADGRCRGGGCGHGRGRVVPAVGRERRPAGRRLRLVRLAP